MTVLKTCSTLCFKNMYIQQKVKAITLEWNRKIEIFNKKIDNTHKKQVEILELKE